MTQGKSKGFRQVVITGMGIVSPLGVDRESSWSAVCEGKSSARYITQFDARNWPTRFACEVSAEFSLNEHAIKKEHIPYLHRASCFAMQAAYEAMQDSGIKDHIDPLRFGIAVGANIGNSMTPSKLWHAMHDSHLQLTGPKATPVIQNHPGTLVALLSNRWQAQGPLTTIQTACASSGQAIGQAFWQLRRGECDAILAGGADTLSSELLLAGFCLIGALSQRNDDPSSASRPFDKDRDGFVAGEGAAFIVLETLEHARARGAKIYAEVAGYGETASAYRITDLPPNGRGIVEAMHQAVQDAGIEYNDIGHINAHGTSTELNDRIEALAIRRVFGSRGVSPLINATKSATGHLISAAGAIELAFTALALRDQMIPPICNLQHTDCGDDLAFVKKQAQKTSLKAAMSNSIGFGGSNSSIVVCRYPR